MYNHLPLHPSVLYRLLFITINFLALMYKYSNSKAKIIDIRTLHAGQPPTSIISGTIIVVECVAPYDGT